MSNKKFLIVDDEKDFRQLMEEILLMIYPDEKIVVDHAESVAKAVAEIDKKITKNAPYDVVITDYSMPEETGSILIEYINRTHPVPIIVVSGVAEALDHDFVQEGAVYFLPKPFDIDTARTVVNAALLHTISSSEVKRAEEAIEKLKGTNIA